MGIIDLFSLFLFYTKESGHISSTIFSHNIYRFFFSFYTVIERIVVLVSTSSDGLFEFMNKKSMRDTDSCTFHGCKVCGVLGTFQIHFTSVASFSSYCSVCPFCNLTTTYFSRNLVKLITQNFHLKRSVVDIVLLSCYELS